MLTIETANNFTLFHPIILPVDCKHKFRVMGQRQSDCFIVMQEASDALSKTADSDTVSTYQVSSVQLVTDKKLEAFNKA